MPGGRCLNGVDSRLKEPAKCVTIDEQPNHEIMPAFRLGEANRPAYQPLDLRVQIDVFALNFLCIGLSHFVLLGIEMRRIGTSPIHIKPGNVLLALKCRGFDTLMRGVFKPGYSGSGCSDVQGSIPIRIHDHVEACTGKFESRAMPTLAAHMVRLGRIGRINKDERHT
jgi:hypothetical protein